MRILAAMREVLYRKGTLTLHLADFEEHFGVTRFDDHIPSIYLRGTQTAVEWRSTLAHELQHALRGPVPRMLADMEEVLVRHRTAELLVPDGSALAMLDRAWSHDDVAELAARKAVDVGTALDALSPPTIPLPAVIPLPRDPDNHWS